MRYARRVDENQAEIVRGLRQIPGCMVYVNSSSGNGLTDLHVFFQGRLTILEIKIPGRRRKLTPAQTEYHNLAWMAGYEIPIVETLDEAIAAVTQRAHTRSIPKEEPCHATN